MKKKLRFRGMSGAFDAAEELSPQKRNYESPPPKTKLQLEEEVKKQKAIVAATLRRNSNLTNMYEALRKKDKNYSQEITDGNKKAEMVRKEFKDY
jgi:hypothetical protein